MFSPSRLLPHLLVAVVVVLTPPRSLSLPALVQLRDLDTLAASTHVIDMDSEWSHLAGVSQDSGRNVLGRLFAGPASRIGRIRRERKVKIGLMRWQHVAVLGAPADVAAARADMGALVTPAASLVPSIQWGHLLDAGVYADHNHIMAALTRGFKVVERELGILFSIYNGRVWMYGPPEAVAAAPSALSRYVTPAVVLDVEATWGHLFVSGRYRDKEALLDAVSNLKGPVRVETGLCVRLTKAGAVALVGSPEEVEKGRLALDRALAEPARAPPSPSPMIGGSTRGGHRGA